MSFLRLEREGILLERQSIERLKRYGELLLEWNATHNLSGAKSRREVEENLFDSLYPLSFIQQPETLLDVGSGAGFPGLALAIAWPETETVLCEPRNKRASFLRYAALELGLQRVSVAKVRAEELEHAPFDLISSRAVSDAVVLLRLTARLADAKSRYLFYKGSRVFDEAEELPPQMRYQIVTKARRNYLLIESKERE